MWSCKQIQTETCHVRRILLSPVQNEITLVSRLYLDETPGLQLVLQNDPLLSESESEAKFSAEAHVCVFCRFLLQFVDFGVKL